MEIPASVNPIQGESQLIRPGFASINAMMISTSSTVVSLEIAQKTLYKLNSHRITHSSRERNYALPRKHGLSSA